VIHSVKLSGDVYLPCGANSQIPYFYAAGYLIVGLILLLAYWFKAEENLKPISE